VSDTNLLLSFANTARDPETDLLSTREDAAAWLAAADLLPAESRLGGADHSALLRLRDSLRDVLATHAGGREDAAAARLTRALADGRLVLTVDPASTVGLASAARASYSNTVALIAVAVAAADAAGTWRRLKACTAPGCGQAFYDDSATGAVTRCEAHSDG
jgi:predicted RNA-binding Zn ribbon-like protein